MKKRSISKIVLTGALAGCMIIGAISAYFTDADTATNTFTVGKVEIDLQEPDWVPPTDITPEQEFAKDPKIENTGINDAYVFIEVVVPYATVITANEDGSTNPAADTELFSYDVKAGWMELGEAKKDTAAKTVTHLYAYGAADAMTAVSAGVTTESVFDYIKFANVVDEQGLEEASLDVVVNSYAIQTTNLNDGKTALDGNNADGKVAPAEVWSVLATQVDHAAGNVNFDKGSEEVNTDIAQ